MRISISVIVIVLAALLTGNAVASETGSGKRYQREVFSIHDTNQDGVLDKYEYQKFSSHHTRHFNYARNPQRYRASHFKFEEIDKDADGYITEDELIIILNKRLRKQRRIRARESQW